LKKISIIGAGAVGRSIALALFQAGQAPEGIYSEQGKSAARLAKTTRTKKYGSLDQFVLTSDIVIISIPDNRIPDVVKDLSGMVRSLKGKIILHTSGSLTSDELAVLHKKGASVGTFHPLQTFPKSKDRSTMKGIWCAIEGDARAVTASKGLAAKIGAKSFEVPKKLKTLYHVAAVFSSNYQVTLFSVVEELAAEIKIPKNQLWKIFRPLVTQTMENVFEASPEEALTGPIARGDYQTISKHLKALESSKKLEHLIPLYSTLGVETAKLAKRKK
jgi:predicted short-subunit dehydrogenase-like oxidoreductase (DUF2520 family)